MNKITLFFLTLFIATGYAESPQVPAFTVNPVETAASTATVDYRDDNRILHIARMPLLTARDFSRAQTSPENGKMLQLQLTDEGAKKIATFSSKHVGEKLAIMINARVIAAPTIRTPIGKSLQIDALDREQADEIARVINHE